MFERLDLKNENQNLRNRQETNSFHHNILGKSPAMKALFDTIHMVAPTDANVLVTGESGTGKELVSETKEPIYPRSESGDIQGNGIFIICDIVSSFQCRVVRLQESIRNSFVTNS